MMKTLSKYWWIALLKGIILIILAIFVFRHPIGALVGVAVYIGVSLLLTGITQTLVSIAGKDAVPNWGWGLAGGLFDIFFSIFFLSNPALTAAALPFVVGFWMIFYGVMTFANAFQAKKEGNSNWGLEMIGGLLTIFIGFVISGNLLAGTLAITIWMGIGFLLAGIIYVFAAFGLKKLS